MTINQMKQGDQLTLAIEGRIDTKTAPELTAALNSSLDGVKELVFDFAKVSYISSAGLRVLMVAQKQMIQQGAMSIIHANADLMEIFKVTGIVNVLTIK